MANPKRDLITDESLVKETPIHQFGFKEQQVTHRRYVSFEDSHYGGGLIDGSFVVGLFGDAATELCIRLDGDEGLFASYDDVQFLEPVRAGDVIETEATILSVGRRSRKIRFEARVVCRSEPQRAPSAARLLDSPLIVATAVGTVVVPKAA
jgi:3-aminobutyryl-CoA ammonia-lyase